MKDIFMVQLDWSTTDADGIDTELYEDYGDAYDRYKEIITEQLKNFWQGEVVFDTDGDPGKDYEFSEEDNNSSIRTAIPEKITSFPKRITTQTNPKFTGIYR